MVSFILTVFGSVVLLNIVLSSIKVVKQQEVAIVEILGKYSRNLGPGLHFIIPIIEQIRSKVNMKIQEIGAEVEVKTKDNMFVHLPVLIQLSPNPENVEDAFYKLQNPEEQITSWILNSLRSIASNMVLEELFSDKEHIVSEVKTVLVKKLNSFGYQIDGVLVDQPSLPEEIQRSFNRVIGAKREAEAATQEGEAIKIKAVAQATAEAESQRVRAKGMADARAILAKGLTESVGELEKNNINAEKAVETLVELNRLDVIREAGNKGNTILFDMNSNNENKEILGLLLKNKNETK